MFYSTGRARLFNDFSQHKCYRVCLDVSTVSHLGTVEFRVLGNFAESFKQHGGFLKLENASPECFRGWCAISVSPSCLRHAPSTLHVT
jgi:anti-anti-sigma regulatory factor